MRASGLVVILLLGCGSGGSKQPDAPGGLDACTLCECTVATQDTDCGAHEVCDVSPAGRQCTCAPAYKRVGADCVFDSAPLDPGFADTTKWSAVGAGATLAPSDPGNLDPGAGVIDRVGMCTLGGFKQSFVMPPRSKADPFKLSITSIGIDPMFVLFDTQVSAGVGGQFGDALVMRNAYHTTSFCLGPRAYGTGAGSSVDFFAGTFSGPTLPCNSSTTASVHIDQVALQVAAPGECPDPGTVVNGDFETPAAAGWTATAIQSATAAIVPAIGTAGSAGLRLATANRCSEATMTGTIAFPLLATEAHPAIELSFTGTAGARLALQLGGQNIGTLSGTGSTAVLHVCVPEWATGTTTSLGFFLQRDSDNACTTALANAFTIDDIKIVSDTACAGDVLTDPGFERIASTTGVTPGWGLTNGHVNDLVTGTAAILDAPASAHGGVGVLRLGASNECALNAGAGAADFALIVPPAQGTAGPAIKFFANVAASNVKTITRASVLPNASGGAGSVDVPQNGSYTQTTLCLPPSAIGRRVFVRFQLSDRDGGACATSYPEEVAFIDDVSVTTDPSCLAQ